MKDKAEAIRIRADFYRKAAAVIPVVKPIVESFEGKMYNCRFDRAIENIKTGDAMRIFCRADRRMFYICASSGPGFEAVLCRGHRAGFVECDIFSENKRIQAGEIIKRMNESYADLLRRAAELERAADELPDTLSRIEAAKKLYQELVSSVPYEVRDICEIDLYRLY